MPAWRMVLMMPGGRRVQVGVSLLVGLSGAVACILDYFFGMTFSFWSYPRYQGRISCRETEKTDRE